MSHKIPMKHVEQIISLSETGHSLRHIAETTGHSKITVAKYRRDAAITNVQCLCGQPSNHNGWCKFRFAASRARQHFMATWGRPSEPSEPLDECAVGSMTPAPVAASGLPVTDDRRECPRCGSATSYKYKKRNVFLCVGCRHQFTHTSGSALHARKMPLEVYHEIARLSQQGSNMLQISRRLGVNYKTVWARVRQLKERA